MSKTSDVIREFAGENKEILISLSLNALVKAVTLALPKASEEVRDLLNVAANAIQVLGEKNIPPEEFKKLWDFQDDSVAHIIALAKADDI